MSTGAVAKSGFQSQLCECGAPGVAWDVSGAGMLFESGGIRREPERYISCSGELCSPFSHGTSFPISGGSVLAVSLPEAAIIDRRYRCRPKRWRYEGVIHSAGIKRRIEANQVDAGVGDIFPEYLQVIAKVEFVFLVHQRIATIPPMSF